jgi:KaiC/GvpD/RAD55 family RecA-like ATPase
MKVRKTNIPKLDEVLEGGLPQSTMTLLWGHPGLENSAFAYHILLEALREGDPCIYVLCSKDRAAVEADMRRYGWGLEEYRGKGNLIFVDAYSGLVDEPASERFYALDPRDASSVTKALAFALKATGGEHTVVVCDSVSTLIDHCGEAALSELAKWKALLSENNATGVFLFTEWPYEDSILTKLHSLSDAVIQLKAVEDRVIVGEYLTVSKLAWGDEEMERADLPFRVNAPGGISILE